MASAHIQSNSNCVLCPKTEQKGSDGCGCSDAPSLSDRIANFVIRTRHFLQSPEEKVVEEIRHVRSLQHPNSRLNSEEAARLDAVQEILCSHFAQLKSKNVVWVLDHLSPQDMLALVESLDDVQLRHLFDDIVPRIKNTLTACVLLRAIELCNMDQPNPVITEYKPQLREMRTQWSAEALRILLDKTMQQRLPSLIPVLTPTDLATFGQQLWSEPLPLIRTVRKQITEYQWVELYRHYQKRNASEQSNILRLAKDSPLELCAAVEHGRFEMGELALVLIEDRRVEPFSVLHKEHRACLLALLTPSRRLLGSQAKGHEQLMLLLLLIAYLSQEDPGLPHIISNGQLRVMDGSRFHPKGDELTELNALERDIALLETHPSQEAVDALHERFGDLCSYLEITQHLLSVHPSEAFDCLDGLILETFAFKPQTELEAHRHTEILRVLVGITLEQSMRELHLRDPHPVVQMWIDILHYHTEALLSSVKEYLKRAKSLFGKLAWVTLHHSLDLGLHKHELLSQHTTEPEHRPQ